MDLRSLHYFITIVEEGNISKAAKKLHLTQPPLSHAIKMLEEELGVLLFHRGTRYIELTEAGQLLYKKALTMLELEQQSLHEINDLKKGIMGSISIGCVSSNHQFLLEKGIIPFHKLYPHVVLEIHEGNTYELLDMLDKNLIEIAIVRTPFNKERYDCYLFDSQPMVACYHKEYFSLPNNIIFLANIQNLPLIMYRRFQNLFDNIAKKQHLDLSFLGKADDARTALLWAESGLGIALLPKYALNYSHNDQLEYREINEPSLMTNVALAYQKKAYHTSIAKAFIECLKKQ